MIIGQSVPNDTPLDRPGVKEEELPPPPKGLVGWRVGLRDFKVCDLSVHCTVFA